MARFELLETRLDGPIFIQPAVFGDERGFFTETYRHNEYAELGIPEPMVQDNHSRSKRGIVRGMHFQIGEGAAKLVRCGRGTIVDVMVDIRRGSPTYGEWEAFELSDENGRVVYCPVGFAHGFCVVERDRRRLLQAEQLLLRRRRAGHQVRRSRDRHRVAGAGRRADPLASAIARRRC